ncbi:MAG: hypothetical protein AB7I27_16700 [Bacteriovoracaceae bacterium]
MKKHMSHLTLIGILSTSFMSFSFAADVVENNSSEKVLSTEDVIQLKKKAVEDARATVKTKSKRRYLTEEDIKTVLHENYTFDNFVVYLDSDLYFEGEGVKESQFDVQDKILRHVSESSRFVLKIDNNIRGKIIKQEGDEFKVAFDKRYTDEKYLFTFKLDNGLVCLSKKPNFIVVQEQVGESLVTSEYNTETADIKQYAKGLKNLMGLIKNNEVCLKVDKADLDSIKKSKTEYQGF